MLSDPLDQFVRTALNFIFNCMVKKPLDTVMLLASLPSREPQRRRDKNKLMDSWNVVNILPAETHCPCTECSFVLSSPLLFRSTLKGVQVHLEMGREHVLTLGLNTWTADRIGLSPKLLKHGA